MRMIIGRSLLYFGSGMVGAAAVRAVMDLLQAEPFDPWAGVLAVGAILMSIGLGLTGCRPWNRIKEEAGKVRRESGEKH